MDCKKCGTPLEENDQFCKNCGAPVNQVSAQTNYGPAPKNSTLKFVLIFLGIAIIIAAVIISVSIFAGDKDKDDDDDDRKTSKKKTEVVTKDDDDEDDDEEIKEKDDEDIDGGVVEPPVTIEPTTKSTYTVRSNGFTFKIPIDLVYETMVDEEIEAIVIGDEENTWMATITPIEASYNKLLTNKSQLQSAMSQQGYTASAAVEKTIGGLSFITLEASTSGRNIIFAYAKANSMYTYSITVMSIDNEFDYDILETVSGILSTAEFSTETTNMEIVKKLDLNAISDLAKE